LRLTHEPGKGGAGRLAGPCGQRAGGSVAGMLLAAVLALWLAHRERRNA
jgi:hypothetical protein